MCGVFEIKEYDFWNLTKKNYEHDAASKKVKCTNEV